MSYTITDRLYNLLPAIYRARDVENGKEALRALVGVIESEFEAIKGDIDTLYDNWFIETCQDWVVPYIGDLLGARELAETGNGSFSRRAFVANTLAYRQRKGTPSVVEQLARDVTGWPGHVVEYFQLLGLTQHLEHQRPWNTRLDLRKGNELELLGSPFEKGAYTADVRHIGLKRGKYNIPNVGIHLWRLDAYPIVKADATADGVAGDGYYRFSQTGEDMQLFNRPQTERSITTLAQEVNVPGALRRRPLYDELEARRAALDAGETPSTLYFGEQPVLELFIDFDDEPLPAEQIVICNLSTWRRPDDGTGLVAVDPVLGRIAFPEDSLPTAVQVSYHYGFSADVGGGSYNRRETLAVADPTIWKVTVSKDGPVDSISAALAAWGAQSKTKGIIEIADSATYLEAETITITLDHANGPSLGEWLVIQAKDGERPTIISGNGEFYINAGHESTSCTLNGVLVMGATPQVYGPLGEINIIHSTLLEGCYVGGENTACNVRSSIVKGLVVVPTARSITAEDSIFDHPTDYAISAEYGGILGGADPAPPTSLERCTIFGKTLVRELTLASETIFTDIVTSERRQVGCVRFSYVPEGSQTPRRYHCQPNGTDTDPGRVRPAFTSTHYGDPGYAQLTSTTATEIRSGAEDGSEMGVFSQLKQPQREANLRIGLDEYMRLGLDTGIFFVT